MLQVGDLPVDVGQDACDVGQPVEVGPPPEPGPLPGSRVIHRPRLINESGTNPGRLRGLVLPGGVGEAGVPASVVVGEGVVEDPGADLQ